MGWRVGARLSGSVAGVCEHRKIPSRLVSEEPLPLSWGFFDFVISGRDPRENTVCGAGSLSNMVIPIPILRGSNTFSLATGNVTRRRRRTGDRKGRNKVLRLLLEGGWRR